MPRITSTRGFTLVEAIVVSVIIAILAVVSIPSYINYINATKQESVNTLAETAAASADLFYRKTGATPVVSNLNLRYDPAKFNVFFSGNNVVVNMVGQTSFTKSVPYK